MTTLKTHPSLNATEELGTKQEIWELYTRSWKVESAEKKNRLFESSVTLDCEYTDPMIHVRGRKALLSYMLDFHQEIPGGHFETFYFLEHHQFSIARWKMKDGAGNELSDGISYGCYDDNNRLVSMTGFYEVPG